MQEFLQGVADARTITDVNIAAGMFAQRLAASKAQRITRMLWGIVALLVASDLLPIGPVDFGLLPDMHIAQWLTGHAYSVDAGHALYHVDKLDHPHVLGVKLPWSDLY